MNFKNLSSCLVIIFLLSIQVHGQNTIGLLLNSEKSSDGYTLYSPVQYTDTYLIDNCGQLINQWSSEFRAGLAAYLLPEGKLLRAGRVVNNLFSASGTGGVVQIFNWDGSLEWEAILNDARFGAHHDIHPTSYGTILLSRWERFTNKDLIQAGKDPNFVPSSLWLPSVVEILPTTMGEFDIVWEWHLFDHLVQTIDPTKDNFGLLQENVRKVNVNFDNITERDWGHCNSIYLNEERDELIISSRNLDEVWVIDHSTTTAEAASDEGGDKGLGGQLLYRFGNDRVYIENAFSQVFDGQHNAKFITSPEGELTIQVFNNNLQIGNSSQIVEVKPLLDSTGNYALQNGRFNVSETPYILPSTDSLNFSSRIMSSVQNLPNGNILINSGSESKFFELTPEGELVWEYVGPVSLFGPNEQGSLITGSTFVLTRYALDDPIFDGLDTSVKAEAIELNPSVVNCGIVSTKGVIDFEVNVYPTLFDQNITIENVQGDHLHAKVFDLQGRQYFSSLISTSAWLDTSQWSQGVYFVKIYSDRSSQTYKLIKVIP